MNKCTFSAPFTTIEDTMLSIKAQLHDAFPLSSPRLILFFSTSNADPIQVAQEMQKLYPECPTFGCTTAGELTSGHMLKNAIVVYAFNSDTIEDVRIEVVHNISKGGNVDQVYRSFNEHFGDLKEADLKKYVGIILIDGMSGAEERLMEKLGDLTDISFVGGSAGDDMKFKETFVFAHGQAHSNAAVLALLRLKTGFSIVKTQSFESSSKTLIATKVNESERIVEEFNGMPATVAYAQSLGVAVEKVQDEFMSHPVGLMIGNEPYVRSPQQAVGEHMKFYCNVKEGARLHVLDATNIIVETKKALEQKIAEVGPVSGIINFHCILRTLELEKKNQTKQYADLFIDMPMIGFSTYGEEYIGHVNQTSTMLFIK